MSLDIYDDFPREMKNYLRHNGWHFNKKACEWAVSLMEKMNVTTKSMEKIEPWKKEDVDALLKKHSITLSYNTGYDYVYVANMCKADFLGESVPDEAHAAKYVKNVIDDADAGEGTVMREWYAKMVSKGIPVDWEEIL